MDKLEQYLDQVCRCLGGPRAMRRHVRQELREHLLDAAAEHRAAGMTKEAALAKALEEFGRPAEVRSELEATHGQRVTAVVIEKAIEWKEMTMKATWLWTTWAHLALAIVIALEIAWIGFAVVFLIPKFQKLLADGFINATLIQQSDVSGMPGFLNRISDVTGHYTTWMVLLAAVAWGVFEWRVRSENKSFMRLSALGTAAVALMGLAVMIAASLIIPYMLSAPAMPRVAG